MSKLFYGSYSYVILQFMVIKKIETKCIKKSMRMRWLSLGLFTKKLNSVQVEVSTFCQLHCSMCPKNVFREDWINKHMELETFKKIPFERFRYAHLQGWGEPLLNPNIIEMIEIAKKAGCSVGLTTNGLLLQDFAKDLAKFTDIVAISIASPNPEIHKKIRKCELSELVEGIESLSKARRNGKPKIVITTIMFKDTVKDLPDLVRLAKNCGADEVIANNLDYIPTGELFGLEVFSERENSEIAKDVENAKKLAEELGVNLVVRPLKLEECVVCAENPVKNCLITVNGDIAPCVYAHLPTKSETIQRVFKGEVIRVRKLYFGNLKKESFKDIWKSRRYKNFRNTFVRRVSMLVGFSADVPDLPEVCKTCYKAYSV